MRDVVLSGMMVPHGASDDFSLRYDARVSSSEQQKVRAEEADAARLHPMLDEPLLYGNVRLMEEAGGHVAK